MNKKHTTGWLILAILFAAGTTVLMFSHMVTDPANMIVQLGGDCGKNYFTFLYHALYGKGVWFDGMNYPYGEHIIYADGQPLISTLLQHIHGLGIRDVLATMNLLISFSYFLAIIFTYKILLRFGIRPVLAIIFACLINMFTPQALRTQAHFALAYMCCVPMLIYWSIRYHESSKWYWLACIFSMGFIMAFVHLYVGAIIVFWAVFYSIGYVLLIRRPIPDRLRHIIPMLSVSIGLFLLIKICIAITDPVKDRPAFPLNTLEYVTHIKDIITSPYAYTWQYIRYKTGFTRLSDGGEGYTYPGISVLLIVLYSLVAGTIKIIRKKPAGDYIISEDRFSPVWVFTGGCILMLAMGVPFVWNMKWLLNYLSVFKQFRAMGRFVWPFYYIIAIYAVYVAHVLFEKWKASNKPVAAYGLLSAIILLWCIDVHRYVQHVRGFFEKGAATCDEFFYKQEDVKWPEYLAQHHYKGSDFQAIILLPFFAVGSEKLWAGGDPSWPWTIGMRASLEFQLPIVDIMMSRTSWSLTEKQVRTIAGPYAYKPMLHDLKSNKPFLLLQFDGFPIDKDQQYLYDASEYLGHRYSAYIYACYPDRLLANDKKHADSVKSILPHMYAADSCIGCTGSWYVSHFDKEHAAQKFFGDGAAPVVHKDRTEVATVTIDSGQNKQYEFSCWVLLDDKDYRSPTFVLELLDGGKKVIHSLEAPARMSVDNDSMWFRASVYFDVQPGCKAVRCMLVNDPDPTYIAIDELQLRPADAAIISKGKDGRVLVNNHRLQ